MSIIFKSSSNFIRRVAASGLPNSLGFSAFQWFKPMDPCCTAAFSWFITFRNIATPVNRGLQFRTTALTDSLAITGNSFPETNWFDPGITDSPNYLGRWWCAGMTCKGIGADDLNAYLWDDTFTLIHEILNLEGHLYNTTWDDFFLCGAITKAPLLRLGPSKVWSAPSGTVLTRTQLEKDIATLDIINRDNIYSALHNMARGLFDYSGNNNHYSGTGDLSGFEDEFDAHDNPPLGLYIPSRRFFSIPAA